MRFIQFLFYGIALIGTYSCKAQKTILQPVKGYREVLEKRMEFSNSNRYGIANDLLQICLQENRSDIIVPLLMIDKEDTTILFFKNITLKKMNKNVSFLDGHKFVTHAFWKIEKQSVKMKRVSFYDSIFQYMNKNMMINSVKFTFNEFTSSQVDAFCCRPKGYSERLKEIYRFFLNGILLREDEDTGRLFYMAY